MENKKRLFFGLEVSAPWPETLPLGRLLDVKHRHMTLAFLGNIPFPPLEKLLETFPACPMKVGSAGFFDKCLLLPPRHPKVLAWHVSWLAESSPVEPFQETLSHWLREAGYPIESREWLPHVTLCRAPFDPHAWKKSFSPLPFYTSAIHLYESVGNLVYEPIWTYPIAAPFVEIDHTADIAFIISGESLLQIYTNAFVALAFKFPEFTEYYEQPQINLSSIDDVVILLNQIVTAVDSADGSPIKAVSFHGNVIKQSNDVLNWEMIVDV
jgi:2'-5' RNA ligase/SHS2 domain-containing protein